MTLAVGAAFLAIHYLAGGTGWQKVGGWLLIASAILAAYTATAMLLEVTFRRVVLPVGKLGSDGDAPGGRLLVPLEYRAGMPGVRAGQ